MTMQMQMQMQGSTSVNNLSPPLWIMVARSSLQLKGATLSRVVIGAQEASSSWSEGIGARWCERALWERGRGHLSSGSDCLQLPDHSNRETPDISCTGMMNMPSCWILSVIQNETSSLTVRENGLHNSSWKLLYPVAEREIAW